MALVVEGLRSGLPLRWLLALAYGVLVALSLLLLGSLIYYRVSSFLWVTGERRILAQVIEAIREDRSPRQGRSFLRRPLRLLAKPDIQAQGQKWVQDISQPGTFVMLVDAQGREIVKPRPSRGRRGEEGPNGGRDLLLPKDLIARVEHGLAHSETFTFLVEGRNQWQVLTIPVVHESNEQQIVAVLLVGSRWQTSEATLTALRNDLMVGSLAILGVAGLLSILLSRLLSGPLERLARTTKQVSEGNMDARTGLKGGRNEVYAVAEAFDQMIDRLQASFNAQSRFVADASHELKTPLTAIGGMVEVLRMGADQGDPERRLKALTSIEKETDRMSNLVSDLLTLSRSDQAPEVVLTPVQVEEVVYEVVGQLRPLWPDHVIEVSGSARAISNFDLLLQVVRNLLENALKYTPKGGRVEVVCGEASGNAVWLEVRDNGVGISAEDLPRVFDRFYRADLSRSRATGGSGLGLSIVQSLVRQLGGEVNLESQLDQGTQARVRLPRGPASL